MKRVILALALVVAPIAAECPAQQSPVDLASLKACFKARVEAGEEALAILESHAQALAESAVENAEEVLAWVNKKIQKLKAA